MWLHMQMMPTAQSSSQALVLLMHTVLPNPHHTYVHHYTYFHRLGN